VSADAGPEPPDLRIFVSYRRHDTSGYAGRLYDSLATTYGDERVFMDIDTIRPGRDFSEVIEEALAECDVVLALIGRSWLTITDAQGRQRLSDPADFVRLELEAALRRRVVTIPLLFQDATMPARDRLPAVLAGLASRQAMELSDQRWRTDMRSLLDELQRLGREKRERPRQPGGLVGAQFGRYRCDELLRNDASSTVYRAFDTVDRQAVTLEVLAAELTSDEEFRARFQRLSRVGSELDATGLVRIIDHGELDHQLYAVTPWIEGADLATTLAQRGPLSAASAVALLERLAGPLDALHSRDLVHADVQPSTVLVPVTADGTVEPGGAMLRITVASARPADALPGVSVPGALDYLAPELLLQQPSDRRADLYALACIFYECLTARPPYANPAPAAVIAGHIQQPVPLLSEVADLPAGLDAVLARAMAKNPADRYPTAAELAAAACATLPGLEPEPAPEPAPVADARAQPESAEPAAVPVTDAQASAPEPGTSEPVRLPTEAGSGLAEPEPQPVLRTDNAQSQVRRAVVICAVVSALIVITLIVGIFVRETTTSGSAYDELLNHLPLALRATCHPGTVENSERAIAYCRGQTSYFALNVSPAAASDSVGRDATPGSCATPPATGSSYVQTWSENGRSGKVSCDTGTFCSVGWSIDGLPIGAFYLGDPSRCEDVLRQAAADRQQVH
jgi:hypothetical protein